MNLKLALISQPPADRFTPAPRGTQVPGRRLPVASASPVEFLVRIRELRRRTLRHWTRL